MHASGCVKAYWHVPPSGSHLVLRVFFNLAAVLMRYVLLVLPLIFTLPAWAQEAPEVLIVTAHPDDEAMFAATVYAVTHHTAGAVDLALVTDGSGGFSHAELAAPLYGLDLDDEAVARQYLPAIRKRELMAGGRIIGLRRYFFLDQHDHAFTTNVDTVLQHVWEAEAVRNRLAQIMDEGMYDYVFVHLPIDEGFHGHHKAASILALEAAQSLDLERRPVVLGGFVGSSVDPETMQQVYVGLPGYPITQAEPAVPLAAFDRTQTLDDQGRLDYRIVVNWLIAEHKSQGTMQLFTMRPEADLERFWYFALNDPARRDATQRFIETLHPAP